MAAVVVVATAVVEAADTANWFQTSCTKNLDLIIFVNKIIYYKYIKYDILKLIEIKVKCYEKDRSIIDGTSSACLLPRKIPLSWGRVEFWFGRKVLPR